MALSPMMQQYMQIKEEHKDCILFYRLGDFYEMFFDDALTASKELELTLTGRDCGLEERAPMCGVPYHACEVYLNRLIAKGYKVAICEQTSDPSASKGIVTRAVVRVVTPGTVIDTAFLDETRNNYIASLYFGIGGNAAVFADISTGQISVFEPEPGDDFALRSELYKYAPAEVVYCDTLGEDLTHFIEERLRAMLSRAGDEMFEYVNAMDTVLRHFKADSLDEIGLRKNSAPVCALGGLLCYLYQTQFSGLEHLTRLSTYANTRYMQMDMVARRNLELCETMREKKKHGSLLGVLDKTKTAAGSRRLRAWLEQPLAEVPAIESRLDAVEAFKGNFEVRTLLSELFLQVTDIERLMTKVVYGTAGGRELLALARTLAVIPYIKEALSRVKSEYLTRLNEQLDPLEDLHDLIVNAIDENCPVTIREGGIIRRGYDRTVDELNLLMHDSHILLSEMEQRERERTGIRTLKIGYNKVFGYYIEISKSFVDQAPEHYVRRQTLTGGERYITGELKELENRIMGASEKAAHLEYELFRHVRGRAADALGSIQQNADALAQVDVLFTLADIAEKNNYVRPVITGGDEIDIKGGRHPVVERVLHGELYVPNDTYLDNSDDRLLIITGPNMAGKSTYMRQIALIVLMAQIGSFVPAQSARIGLVDRIFTRVGASDDLSSGQSTFMLEMTEVADIIHNATAKSLIIYDEIGRGTSTFDGMSIARAVLEHTADKHKLGAKCVFATHYHELTALEGRVPGVKNYRTAVKKRGDEILFLRKIVRGAADDSYGIEVAKLAGVPEEIIENAKSVLAELENGGQSAFVPALSLTEGPSGPANGIMAQLRMIDAETLSPLEGLNLLHQLSERAREEA